MTNYSAISLFDHSQSMASINLVSFGAVDGPDTGYGYGYG